MGRLPVTRGKAMDHVLAVGNVPSSDISCWGKLMEPIDREKLALFRYKLIAPFLEKPLNKEDRRRSLHSILEVRWQYPHGARARITL